MIYNLNWRPSESAPTDGSRLHVLYLHKIINEWCIFYNCFWCRQHGDFVTERPDGLGLMTLDKTPFSNVIIKQYYSWIYADEISASVLKKMYSKAEEAGAHKLEHH